MLLSTPIWWSYVVVGSDYLFNIDLYNNMDSDFVLNYLMVNSLLKPSMFPFILSNFDEIFLQKKAIEN